MFFMGTDFSKLKAPLVWYDLLHVLDVLSNYPNYRNDPRLLSMAGCVEVQSRCGWVVYPGIDLDRLEGLGIWSEESAVVLGNISGYKDYEKVDS